MTTTKPPALKPKNKLAVRTIIHTPRVVKAPKVRKASTKRKPKPVRKKAKNPYAKLKKQIKKLPKKTKKNVGKITSAPRTIAPQSVIAALAEGKQKYIEKLLAQFHETLELPEIGTVVIKLEIGKEGCKNLTIIRSESTKNAAYLQKHLPEFDYPEFNSDLSMNDTHEFEITFCNEY